MPKRVSKTLKKFKFQNHGNFDHVICGASLKKIDQNFFLILAMKSSKKKKIL